MGVGVPEGNPKAETLTQEGRFLNYSIQEVKHYFLIIFLPDFCGKARFCARLRLTVNAAAITFRHSLSKFRLGRDRLYFSVSWFVSLS